MKTLIDPQSLLEGGLAAIRTEFQVPAGFAPEVLVAADSAAKRAPTAHVDRTDVAFVTLDPAHSTDLDQAFAIEQTGAAAGGDIILRYAIADVAWFVGDGDPIDTEAWARGETLYLPDGRAPLHPPVLCEAAASLLPDGPRPAIIFAVRVAADGAVKLDGVERAVIRSRAKLAYENVTAAQLPAGFDELSRRIAAAETARGASRVDPPEQELGRAADGHFALTLAPQNAAELANAAMSLATNLAVADALLAAKTGLFRVMAGPDERACARLRHTATALGLVWPAEASLEQFTRRLDLANPRAAAFSLAVRRAGHGASYVPYQAGVIPWHAAMAATYCHATAPLRRLADRYVIRAALAVANGQPVPEAVSAAFARLGPVMAKSGQHAAQIDRAVIDLAEAALLNGRVGERFAAVVTDQGDNGARIQLTTEPVVARIAAPGAMPGDALTVKLDAVDPAARTAAFSVAP